MKKALIVFLLLLAGCATAPPADDSAAINDLLSRWQKALRKGDARALSSLVTEDAEFWTADAPPLIGRNAIRQRFSEFFKNYSMDQQFETVERVIGRDHVLLRGIESNRLTQKGNNAITEIEQRAFSVVRRDRDGRWRFARNMTNFISRPGVAQ